MTVSDGLKKETEMSNTQLTTLSDQLAAQFNLGSGEGLLDTLKRTAFKGNC